jgi:hypothetical protein
MQYIVRKILAIVSVVLVLALSFFAWFYIEISFDGCCGARANFANDNWQALAHFGAYAVAIGLIWLVLWWGWRRPKQ